MGHEHESRQIRQLVKSEVQEFQGGEEEANEHSGILRILRAAVVGPAQLELTFNDGTEKSVAVRPLLEGPIFDPFHDPERFAEMTLDSVCGTVTWPNGADLAPEALLALSPVKQAASTN